ncbi:hypothetical protein Flexsi_1540 [Flexistipes sinusarabici DSM 4947]|uniref:1,4-dihydroxy-6-naphtoate synthase n=1 Tax=Flexistipes sinusarabici (strain ATCC 49648 / DSM 4947 / MAS 10) TaxID=717231 RepID=F8E8R7_FLESM|nr:1,4-dihydroxy-6-naphthoate synthase [Flexistipes sinusarabici]AEI15190.1 hypothetical protein Flexsi_1540 [Flexistipes sinusarabici DSM 4947]
MELRLGISTCPNDTFIFMPIIHNFVDTSPFTFRVVLDDVEKLNGFAVKGILDVVKVSYGVVPKVKNKYNILKSGGALGYNCGPVVVSSGIFTVDELKGGKIAIPGENTTAYMIFKYFFGEDFDFIPMRFDKIILAVEEGKADAGILIHEGRFVYSNHGLNLLADLGELWEKKQSAPIPLGAILLTDKLKKEAKLLNNIIKSSIKFSRNNFEIVKPFVYRYAQQLDDDVIKKHIELFVNEYSLDVTPVAAKIAPFIQADERLFV